MEHLRHDRDPAVRRRPGAARGAGDARTGPRLLLRQHHLLVHAHAGAVQRQQVPRTLRHDDRQNGETPLPRHHRRRHSYNNFCQKSTTVHISN